MKFTKPTANLIPITDPVFTVLQQAKKDVEINGNDMVTNATIGTLFDENFQLVAFDSVFSHYNKIDNRIKAAYASSFVGNADYNEAVFNWVTEHHVDQLHHRICATPGGSGAVSSSFTSFLEEGETVIIPNIGWSSYPLMATQNNLKFKTYEMFDQKNQFHLSSLKQQMEIIAQQQNRVVIVINDPCHNPCGYTMTHTEWKSVINIANEIAKTTPVIIINDIAYIDYSNHLSVSRDYLDVFNQINDNVLITIAFSCSKTLTSYGLRCGAAIILSKQAQDAEDAIIVFEKTARATWSNIPNAAMANFAWIVNQNKETFLKEKKYYIDLLKQRSSIFLHEAKKCGLEIYPYKEGFFITLAIHDQDLLDKLHTILIENHIYTVKVHKGIRIAICSLSCYKIYGLAEKIQHFIKILQGDLYACRHNT